MNAGKRGGAALELPAHKRFAKSRSRWIYPSFQNANSVFCGDWGSANKHETGGLRVNESACFCKVGTALHCLPVSCSRS